MDKLLPCPFCGGKAELYRIPNNHQLVTGEWILEDIWDCGCRKCLIGFSALNDRDLAVKKWNTRTHNKEGEPNDNP